MKRILFGLIVFGFSAQAQVTTEDYLWFCDELVTNTSNSVKCLHTFYKDLTEFKKDSKKRFRYHDSYDCIAQPNQKLFDKVKVGTNPFYKPLVAELWRLYNDAYKKGGEIVVFVRLEDYNTDIEKGFRLLKEMHTLQSAIAEIRDKMAAKVADNAKALPPVGLNKTYQQYLNAILHEEKLIRKLSLNFNDGIYTGFAQKEILDSYLETDLLLQTLTPSNFKIVDIAPLRSCFEGLQRIQKTKQTALDDFNNTSMFDGQYANSFYNDMLVNFDNELLYFFYYVSKQIREAGVAVSRYPLSMWRYDTEVPAESWASKREKYDAPIIDTLSTTKQVAPLPVAGFYELNRIVEYINECVGSLENLSDVLRNEESTWEDLKKPNKWKRKRVITFDHFKVPVSLYGLIGQNRKNIPTPYQPSLLRRVDDLQYIMLIIQDKLFGLSQFIANGGFDEKSADFAEQEVKTLEALYSEFDLRKEKLYLEVRKVYFAYPPAKSNAWVTSSRALLKAADDSRTLLRQVELKLYEGNEQVLSTTNIHEDRRDLITNELKYMNGIQLLGKNNGNCPYTPYEYIPDYLNTTEEKIQKLPANIKEMDIKDVKKIYRSDFIYMHNRVIDEYNKFAELGLGNNEYGRKDPMRPVNILNDILQLQKYRYDPPKPEVKIVPPIPVEQPKEIPKLDDQPFNNMVLLLDVSSSMNVQNRLPLLKTSFKQMIKKMRKEDDVSIVVYSGKATVLLTPTSASDTSRIIQAIQNLKSDGRTNVADGLNLAYKTARKNLKTNGNNRIIMATDGEFNVGEALYKLAEKNSPDILLTVFDFSQKADPISSIQSLAERGKGNYVKVTPDNSLEVLMQEARNNK